MSKNTFNLSNEAAPPEEEPLDEFDQFDEMFLRLNNALIEKRDELQEKAAELDKRETELDLKERELNDTEAELICKKKELKHKEEQLFKLDTEIQKVRKENKDLDKKLAEQEELEAHLRNQIFEKNYNTPWIMFEIPPVNGQTNLRFITKLNSLGSKEIYSQTQSLIYPIDKRLRELYTRAKTDRDEDKQIKIAATYYIMSFSYDTYEEIANTLERYIEFLEVLQDRQLNAMAKELKEKPLTRIRDLAKG